MKVLFLDIDFVLNSHLYDLKRSARNEMYIPYYSEIDPECVERLSSIVSSVPELYVVISSAWRDDLFLDTFKDIFSINNFPADKIIATTEPFIDKSAAIEQYVYENKISEFVILDDDCLFDKDHDFFGRFYRVPTVGLRDCDILPIIKIFNEQK